MFALWPLWPMHLTIRQAKGHIMRVSLYTYFIGGTQLNVRVHECDCGDEPEYHPIKRKMTAYDYFINWPERDIRALAQVSYAKLASNELFVITDGTPWHVIENDVLRIMVKADELNKSTLLGMLAVTAADEPSTDPAYYTSIPNYLDRTASRMSDGGTSLRSLMEHFRPRSDLEVSITLPDGTRSWQYPQQDRTSEQS